MEPGLCAISLRLALNHHIVTGLGGWDLGWLTANLSLAGHPWVEQNAKVSYWDAFVIK
jgi:hypothetical protein